MTRFPYQSDALDQGRRAAADPAAPDQDDESNVLTRLDRLQVQNHLTPFSFPKGQRTVQFAQNAAMHSSMVWHWNGRTNSARL
jgi:hypothetical protein